MENQNEEDILEYFLRNIFLAKSAYEAWKTLYCAKSENIVGKDLSERYLKIQKCHPNFFGIAERSCLATFVITICHVFDDNRTDSFSLDKASKEDYDNFFSENKEIIKQLQRVRHKVFAHGNIRPDPEDFIIPAVDKLNAFFEKLESFYNLISNKINKSGAIFDNALEMKNDIERLYMNIERGENIRLREIDIEWHWKQNDNKISKKI